MKIWDIRSPSPSQPRAQFRHSPGLGFVDNGFASSSSAAIAYSCVRAHDAQEQVICGSSSGLVAKWDLRSSIVQTASLHEKKGIKLLTILTVESSSVKHLGL